MSPSPKSVRTSTGKERAPAVSPLSECGEGLAAPGKGTGPLSISSPFISFHNSSPCFFPRARVLSSSPSSLPAELPAKLLCRRGSSAGADPSACATVVAGRDPIFPGVNSLLIESCRTIPIAMLSASHAGLDAQTCRFRCRRWRMKRSSTSISKKASPPAARPTMRATGLSEEGEGAGGSGGGEGGMSTGSKPPPGAVENTSPAIFIASAKLPFN
mmetsp:Transcript_4749/g.8629  ORF Transcript_4749/g.8629 Transcript_4749/m.8629 type:complete len:215 (+) Transcript_4749:1328-1972(+)